MYVSLSRKHDFWNEDKIFIQNDYQKKKLADLQKLEEPSTQKCANPLLSAY